MLKVSNLHSYYGPIEALKGIDIDISSTDIVCLIGANGAGKTTLLKTISGILKRTGKIMWNDDDITENSPRKIAKHGIIHVPEGRHVFPGLTVKENLETGTINWHGFFGRESYQKDFESVYNLFPKLKERENQYAWSLSGGEQQMLAIGRGIMGRPKLLMLDEPSMGLAPVIVDELFEKIVAINKLGTPILLIEQNANIALEISKYCYVIDQGSIMFHGPAEELKHDSRIEATYLGKFTRKDV